METKKCKVRVFCSNCNFDGEVEMLKEALTENHPCPECGSKALVERSRSARFLPQIPRIKKDFR